MKKSNCILYAVALKKELNRKGYRCHYAFRISDWGFFPHVLVTFYSKRGTLRMVSFKPVDPTKRTCPPAKFVGYVAWGDIAPRGVSQ